MLQVIQVEGDLYNLSSNCHISSPIKIVILGFQHGSHLTGMAPEFLVRIQEKNFCRRHDISEFKIPKVSLFHSNSCISLLILPGCG